MARIDHGALRELGAEALSQPPPKTGLAIACRELWVRAARMQLTPSTAFRGREHFALDLGRGHIRKIPLERDDCGGIWLSGPIDGYATEPSIAVRVTNLAGALELELHMHWSLWSDPGEPGRVALDEGVNRLIAAGWSRE